MNDETSGSLDCLIDEDFGKSIWRNKALRAHDTGCQFISMADFTAADPRLRYLESLLYLDSSSLLLLLVLSELSEVLEGTSTS